MVQCITRSRRKRKRPELPALERSFEVMHLGGGKEIVWRGPTAAEVPRRLRAPISDIVSAFFLSSKWT
ncbi:hypothetical protein CO660_12260 [Rhizobium sp. L9]|nr:hypothetical protein CO660_12260 [Rhizobium sp. L9]